MALSSWLKGQAWGGRVVVITAEMISLVSCWIFFSKGEKINLSQRNETS